MNTRRRKWGKPKHHLPKIPKNNIHSKFSKFFLQGPIVQTRRQNLGKNKMSVRFEKEVGYKCPQKLSPGTFVGRAGTHITFGGGTTSVGQKLLSISPLRLLRGEVGSESLNRQVMGQVCDSPAQGRLARGTGDFTFAALASCRSRRISASRSDKRASNCAVIASIHTRTLSS